jgi:hypothetical protein
MTKRKSDGPVTIKEALSKNVKDQQRRADETASPPEAQRPPRERVRDAENKTKQSMSISQLLAWPRTLQDHRSAHRHRAS